MIPGKILICELCTTVSSQVDATTLTDLALNQKLAACVHQKDLRSSYVWQGKRETASEFELVFITTVEHEPRLREKLKSQHPYECPAFYVRELGNVDEDYLNWIFSSL